MTGAIRSNAIDAINNSDIYINPIEKKLVAKGKTFGELCFSKNQMKKTLSKAVYANLLDIIDGNSKLDNKIADKIAIAMQEWAVSKGATHFTHVFYPLTGWSAEKHDTLVKADGQGSAVSKLSGKMLLQGEPDASSFPNGGIRETHEARGYTAWDPASPAYIVETESSATLCIPTIFVSWTGEALDTKLPLYRAEKALDIQVRRILKFLKHKKIDGVVSNAGVEQEYFLVDCNFYSSRPDLVLVGRTVLGAPSSKGQEFDDHYFGVISERVINYMAEVDAELFKVGIPATTRHNEVAPGQFEIAPVFERSGVAADHQQLLMSVLKRVALRHGLVCLLHEKPFAGLNGNGKHLNWSISNQSQGNLFDPGNTPHKNLQFLIFCAGVIRAVHKFGGLLRMTVASAGNDHRLGANEAPPAILSVFLGEQLLDIFDQIKKGTLTSSKKIESIDLNISSLPTLTKDPGDRNRTSPFAFTGNRFEFRAVGGNQNISKPLLALNMAMTESLDYIATALESSKEKSTEAILKVLQSVVKKHGQVVFNGNGYSSDWHKEAKQRGLLNLVTTADAYKFVEKSKEVEEAFSKYDILTPREVASRIEISSEIYNNTILVEAKVLLRMAKTMVVPSAVRFEQELAVSIIQLKTVGIKTIDKSLLNKVVSLHNSLTLTIEKLDTLVQDKKSRSLAQSVQFNCFKIIPAMNAVRSFSDALELVVADDLWSLPTYQEMLFLK